MIYVASPYSHPSDAELQIEELRKIIRDIHESAKHGLPVQCWEKVRAIADSGQNSEPK